MNVSVLMATFRSEATVEATIKSVLEQTGVQVELLIADGLSNDRTPQICSAYKDKLAYYISEKDAGVYDAWNKLIPKAKGEWICFLGSDDIFASPQALMQLVQAASKRPDGCRVVYGNVEYVDSKGKTVVTQGEPWGAVKAAMRKKMSIPHVGTLHHKSIFSNGQLFDSRYRIAGDFALLRKECLANGAYFAQDVKIAIAGWGGISTHPRGEVKTQLEILRILQEQAGFFPPLSWVSRFMKVLLRYGIFSVFGQDGLNRYESLKKRAGIKGNE
jgi:glycosyltransferase involved in cell wall biosynthesis